MKKVLYSILLFACVCVALSSCSNGDYSANPNSNANNSVNPLKPLTIDEFTWTGTGRFSCKINGALWVADTAFYFLDTNGFNRVYAYKDSFRQIVNFSLKDTWRGNLYNMGFKQYNTSAIWVPNILDSVIFSSGGYSSALGNSGQLYMITNDTMDFRGKFYFQAVNLKGDVTNFSDGWFDLKKWDY